LNCRIGHGSNLRIKIGKGKSERPATAHWRSLFSLNSSFKVYWLQSVSNKSRTTSQQADASRRSRGLRVHDARRSDAFIWSRLYWRCCGMRI
jgi:hypothetical protein